MGRRASGICGLLLTLGWACGPAWASTPAAEFELLKDLGRIVEVYAGVHLSMPADFKITNSFDPAYAFIFNEQENGIKDTRCVIPGDPKQARKLYEEGLGEIGWSPDGAKIYDFDGKVILEFDISQGRRTVLLTSPASPRSRWPDYYPSSSPTRFCYDRVHQRLVYSAWSTKGKGQRLLALSIPDRKETVLIGEQTLPKQIYGCDIALDADRFYAQEQWNITVWTLTGKKLATIPLLEHATGDLVLSPDRRKLIVERAREPVRGNWLYKGFDLLDTQTHELRPQIDWGHDFRWSPDGRQIAFLNKDNELWLFDVQTAKTRQLVACDRTVSRTYAPYISSPAWSRDGRMLSATISTWLGTPHTFAFHTVIVDLKEKTICHIPRCSFYSCWAPDAKVFRKQPAATQTTP